MSWIGVLLAFVFCVAAEAGCKKIKIDGNVRISRASILGRLHIKKGQEITEQDLNAFVKDLYASELFAWVRVTYADEVLTLDLRELPSVNTVTFDGNDNADTSMLEQDLGVSPRQILSKDKLRKATMRISGIYRRLGYFKAQIDPQVIYRPQNRVDVIFSIKEGQASIVSEVAFVGNKDLSDLELSGALSTKAFRWWRFLKAPSLFDPTAHVRDGQLLQNYYYDRGYIDFEVESVNAQLSTLLESFTVLYQLREGKPYNVRDVVLENEVPEVDNPLVWKYLLKKKKRYRRSLAAEDMSKLERFFASAGHPYVRVGERLQRHKGCQEVTVHYVTYTVPRITVRRVTIQGNRRTYDRVLYPLIDIWEGDILDERNVRRTQHNLERLGFFESVSVEKVPSDKEPNAVDVNFLVKEQPTGTLGIKGSYSHSMGGRVDMHFDEANFFGRGLIFKVNGSVGGYSRDFSTTFADPAFMYKNILAGATLRLSSQVARDVGRSKDREEYRVVIRGARVFFSFPIRRHWSIRPGYGLSFEQYQNIQAKIYSIRKNQFISPDVTRRAWQGQWLRDGKAVVSKANIGLAYDRRDRRFDAMRGLFAFLNLEVAGLGGDIKTWQLSLDTDYHYKINDLFTLRARGYASMIRPWREKDSIRVIDRYRLGGPDSIRGFSEWGVGPRYFQEAIGGDTSLGCSFELLFPLGLPKEARFRGFLFFDCGSTWDHYAKLPKLFFLNDLGVRVSVGIGVRWASPMGVISISYGIPLRSYKYDIEDRVNLGMKSSASAQSDFL